MSMFAERCWIYFLTMRKAHPTVGKSVRDLIPSVLEDVAFLFRPSMRVGPFELGGLLGSGGMGWVFEGHRVDGAVRQRVAVKFVQLAAVEPWARRSACLRFLREREMLASLRHPYIAGLIDAGTLNDVPYAVIEQVDGAPIDVYCKTSELSVEERVRLVLRVCDAVQFAHRNLIVHSDIKPENILVTPDGIPKLIDFGIASDLADEDKSASGRAFTPGYASPEQSQGLPPTVATDVYGIGAVLYRLLTGSAPRSGTGPMQELMRAISEDDIALPSSIDPKLRGDLDNIVGKALRRDAMQRYGSVTELAEDLNRYLSKSPVRATPDTWHYRTHCFLRRHWAVATAITALVLSLATVAVIETRQRVQALRDAAEVRHLAGTLLFDVHDEIGGLLGATKAREKLGQIAVQYLERLEKRQGRDPELTWELMNAYARLARSKGGGTSNVGDGRGGADLARKTMDLAAAVQSTTEDTERLDQLFRVYEELAPILREAERHAVEREAVDRMFALAEKLGPLRQAQALTEQARYFDSMGQQEPSAESFRRALAILRPLSAGPDKPEGTDAQLLSVMVAVGRTQALAGDFAEAAATLRESIVLGEKSQGSAGTTARALRQLYWSHIALGDLLGSSQRFNLGRREEAVQQYAIARQLAESLVRLDEANVVVRLDLARALSREAGAVSETEPGRALELLDRARSLDLPTAKRDPAALDSRLHFLTDSVPPLSSLRRFEEAQRFLTEARGVAEEMRRAGMAADFRAILKAEAVYRFAAGDARGALATARQQLALSDAKTSPVLSVNFIRVEVLRRIRMYETQLGESSCSSTLPELGRIWSELRVLKPRSRFVREQYEQTQAARTAACGGR